MSDATYNAFHNAIREIGVLGSIEQLLEWDSETYMPAGGTKARAEQMSLLAALAHERRTSPRLGEWLDRLDGESDDPVRQTNVREMRRIYERSRRLPTDLVRRITKASVIAKDAWIRARAASAFAVFAPHLGELLDLKRQAADCIGFADEPYDALLDEFEPGVTTRRVAAVFSDLRGPLSKFAGRIASAPRKPDASIVHRRFSVKAQERFVRMVAAAIGFDFQRGRLDISAHPFCSGAHPDDIRLTTRYDENFLSPAIFGVMHEAGHGMYEQGYLPEHAFTPAGMAASLGVHESQSRLWENFVGRSRAFWEGMYGACRAAFPEALGDVSVNAFYGAINAVCPSPIRVEADEVTYNLHIILRFELEREMIGGRLAVNDVPEAWNAKLIELLGITSGDDARGCLQDIHWALAAFGYFPTYALGNLMAAQFFDAARRAIGDLDERLCRGDFATLLDWLRANIHVHGQRFRADELVRRVTGQPLDTGAFLDYVRAKFGPIYGL